MYQDAEEKRIDLGIEGNLREGLMEVIGYAPDGDRIFKLTDKGRARVEEMLKDNPNLFIEMGLDKGLH